MKTIPGRNMYLYTKQLRAIKTSKNVGNYNIFFLPFNLHTINWICIVNNNNKVLWGLYLEVKCMATVLQRPVGERKQ